MVSEMLLCRRKSYLVEYGFDFVNEVLRSNQLRVVVLYDKALVVERLQVVLNVLFVPYSIEAALCLAPLVTLVLQPAKNGNMDDVIAFYSTS